MKKCSLHHTHFPEENEWFPCTEEYFYKNKTGLYPYCKECTKKKSYESKIRNRESYLASTNKYNSKPDIKQMIRDNSKRQRESGYMKEYQQKNKKLFNTYSKDKQQNRSHKIAKKEWTACKEYFKNLDGEYCCAYCGMIEKEHKKIFNQQLHKEHVIHEGKNDLSNCIPACKSCNSQKWKFSLEEWYKKDNPVFSQERLNKINKWLTEDYKKAYN